MPRHLKKAFRETARAAKEKPHVPREFTDAARGVRLQRVLAAAGVASRREAESLITTGRVQVNGKPVTALPAWVDPRNDRVEVDGQLIDRPRTAPPTKGGAPGPGGAGRTMPAAGLLYVMLNKPRRIISSTRDDLGRRGVTDLVELPDDLPARLFPVGRLDADTSGLMLLTNDGALANRLTHRRFAVPRQYLASVRGRVTEEQIESLRRGVYLAPEDKSQYRTPGQPRASADGHDHHRPAALARPAPHGPHIKMKKARMDEVRIVGVERDKAQGDRTTLAVTIKDAQNREIRRMLARIGLRIRRLQRVAIGPLRMRGVKPGEWRFLKPEEVRSLRDAVK